MFCEWKYSAKFEFMFINFLLMDQHKKIHQNAMQIHVPSVDTTPMKLEMHTLHILVNVSLLFLKRTVHLLRVF